MAVAGPRRMLWAVEMAVLVMIGLLAMASPTMQVSMKNPLREAVQKISEKTTVFAIIVTANSSEKAFNESGIFNPISSTVYKGRIFLLGTIQGSKFVFVNSPSFPTINVAITVEILADKFDLLGIIYFGSAAALNDSLSIGTVALPSLIGATGLWKWQPHGALKEGQLNFGEFNYPKKGENLLGSVQYEKSKVYINGTFKESIWIGVTPEWQQIADEIEVDSVQVVHGLSISSAKASVNNEAYKNFLYNTFKTSVVDTSSVAVALGAHTNELPFILFNGVSNYADGSDVSNNSLANANAVKVLNNFIYLLLIGSPAASYDD
ncbi:hypothetical protein P3X46_005206 [Hevea brasiliensis]|uniref:Nucleoside phosphorylase domain-containing protein n=1 Tax=Hevea brasiliensis TaxID=3981 RepID=A0ABQ9N0G3_HEVBR|nr:bark storage protein A [Hevea brasiliensis]KAJ9185594.1 hypothetical protein P3X46_005206 [Hevea brasiliensis]